jgi:hypothetical protein
MSQSEFSKGEIKAAWAAVLCIVLVILGLIMVNRVLDLQDDKRHDRVCASIDDEAIRSECINGNDVGNPDL